ncbi:Fe-S cluster assembly protein SufD [Thermoleophilum album]|uniref:Fe-S cluster assembly protein SufD n=1 Tax=Thermoleophilum album TaxID=29539 RepID=A0A1H6FKW8_THEAL|nr:Fe-S cluster assembly protein SufD [Thermoleophilum album]SEH11496.1 Fe-S cluster assembly protein SufD [Thermoleophilum album]
MASAAAARGTEPSWLSDRRRRAAEAAAQLPLPDSKTPGWEFTDLSGLDFERYELPAVDAAAAASPIPLFDALPEGLELACVDGQWRAHGGEAPGGALLLPLEEAIERIPSVVERNLGSIVAVDDPFVARNELAWRHGAVVYVPEGVRVSLPLVVRAGLCGEHLQLPWRTLIVLERGAQAEVFEEYLGPLGEAGEGVDALLNAVVEIVVGEGASLTYVCGQRLSERSWGFATQRARVARDGRLDWVVLGFGGANGKFRTETQLVGENAWARVTGAYAGRARQHLDFDTTQEHAAPHTTSDLAFRGILSDRATAVWRGMIRVDPGAQRTDAFQESRNLLLSRNAHADAIPGLEIEANDVRCTHAAAVAQIDREQLFYLRAHGVPEAAARRLVIEGFLQELVERFPEGEVHDTLSAALERRLVELLGS